MSGRDKITDGTAATEATDRWVVGKTRYNKDIVARRDREGMYRIELGSGGRLPPKLKGLFTSLEAVDRAVYTYLVTNSATTRNRVIDANG